MRGTTSGWGIIRGLGRNHEHVCVVNSSHNFTCFHNRPVMRFAIRNAAWSKHIRIISQPRKTMATSHGDQAPLCPYAADKYARRADHTANTAQEEEDSYILALHTDPEHHKRVTALRTQYFPPRLNKLSAHIALFVRCRNPHTSRLFFRCYTQTY